MLTKLVNYSIFLILAINFYVWGSNLDWEWDEIGLLELFPLLGLIAFSTMWWHFLTGFIRRLRPDVDKFRGLHQASAYWVFASFMLHPLLLVIWGIQEEIGTPWEIYEDYAGPKNMVFIVIGLLALGGFLLFDLARVLSGSKLLKRHRGLIMLISDISFVLILIHSLNLGGDLREGWFRVYWLLLGISGIGFIIYRYYFNSKQKVLDHGTPAKN